MQETRLFLHPAFTVGPVDERLFGGFIEHLGRCVYQGVYDPDSAHADEQGFRGDVLAALEPLALTAMRYPGGNFASGYHWRDGVGPRHQRPTVRELAWQSIEPNHFGTDEYIALCRRMNWTPMLTVNLGTGTPEEAAAWVEYCNAPPGTRYADLRRAHGHEQPHDVRLWCLGNEMDGNWQLGHVPARDYAVRAQQAAKMMKDADGRVELVVCGSCAPVMPTYMKWDYEVLDCIGDYADYVSLHRYAENETDDTADFLAVTNAIDSQIEQMDAACRFVQAKHKSPKRLYLCFDEWNVWYRVRNFDGQGRFAPAQLEEPYNLEDALVVAGFLNSFLRHADVVKIANLAQIVNVIAPLTTRGDELLKHTIYYPLEMYASRRRGVALRPVVRGPSYDSRPYGPAPLVDAAAVLDCDRLSVFLVNRSLDGVAPVVIDLAGAQWVGLENAETLGDADPKRGNSFELPREVTPRPFEAASCRGNQVRLALPPLTLLAATFRVEAAPSPQEP